MDQKSQLEQRYQEAKLAFESGEYRQSVQLLESVCLSLPQNTKKGGEVRLWLVMAYQALNQYDESIELCSSLLSHPFMDTRTQAKQLKYILEAPRLQRPEEWMTKIPDLTQVQETKIEYKKPVATGKPKLKKEEKWEDLSQINTRDNLFLILSLGIILGVGIMLWVLKI